MHHLIITGKGMKQLFYRHVFLPDRDEFARMEAVRQYMRKATAVYTATSKWCDCPHNEGVHKPPTIRTVTVFTDQPERYEGGNKD